MDRLEAIDDHGKELASLKSRMMVVEKKGRDVDTSALEVNIDKLKKEVTSLWSINLCTIFDKIKDPPLKVDVAANPDKKLDVRTLGDSSKENQEVSTPETDEESGSGVKQDRIRRS